MLDHGRIFREAWIAGATKHYPGEPKPSYIAPREDADWERRGAAAVHEQVRAFIDTADGKITKLARA